ncbi:MAG: hypothetical protein RJQ07_03050 [Pseudomonadales bacterium]
MSFEKRRTATVTDVILELVREHGKTALRPGDVNTVLRERGMPMGSWEVRAEFSRLERMGKLQLDEASGDWFLTENASLENTG